MAKKIVTVTPAQKSAAKVLVGRSSASGKYVSKAVAKIAEASPDRARANQ